MECPKCGKKRLIKTGTAVVGGGERVQLYRCKDCGHVFREKTGD